MGDADNTIGSLERGLRIIEELCRHEWTGVSQLSDALDLPKSTVYSYLNTLHEEGYVRAEDGEYQPTLRFLEFGEQIRLMRDVYKHAKPELDELAEETGELVNLSVEEGCQGVYLYLAHGPNAVNVDTYPGMQVPLYCTALGKVALAFVDEDRRERCIDACSFEKLTENTVMSPDALRDELRHIREQRYALDRGERGQDLRCVAAPILVEQEYRGAISVTAPVSRMQRERFKEEIPSAVVDTANVIQISMTYS